MQPAEATRAAEVVVALQDLLAWFRQRRQDLEDDIVTVLEGR